MLLAAAADKNATDNDGVTPILIATEKDHHNVVEILLAANAEKNIATMDGLTPIMAADLQAHQMIVWLLA